MTLSRQQRTPPAIRVGPISLSSRVLKPFSPVPTKAMTIPTATVPRPTYSKALAAALSWPKGNGMSSSSELEPPKAVSWIYREQDHFTTLLINRPDPIKIYLMLRSHAL